MRVLKIIGLVLLLVVIVAASALWSRLRPDLAARVFTGFVAHDICAKAFVSGLDPAEVFAEDVRHPGVVRLKWLLRYDIDRGAGTVDVSVAGLVASRAVFRKGSGCIVLVGDRPPTIVDPAALTPDGGDPATPALPGFTEPASHPRLSAVIDRAFGDQAGLRGTRAIVVASADGVIAERYAPGVDKDSPLLGYSMTKSMMNALIGVLVRKQLLSMSQPAPFAQWRSETDGRRLITIENLLRMTSGLDLGEQRFGFDRSSRIHYLEYDMAAAAAASGLVAQPGTRWDYSSGDIILLSRVARDVLGGAPVDMLKFAKQELFRPLGMRSVTLELDSVGTCVCSINMLASARDWARLGSLHLSDGVAGGQRILPEGWVDLSAKATLDTDYGAGFWTNRSSHPRALDRIGRGLPPDAFYAFGSLGQMLMILPTQKLVIVRLGSNVDETPELRGLSPLVTDIIAAARAE